MLYDLQLKFTNGLVEERTDLCVCVCFDDQLPSYVEVTIPLHFPVYMLPGPSYI
jgi:hypothetical protein